MWKISPGHSDDEKSRFHKEKTRDQRAASWVADGYISVGFGDVSGDLYGSSWETIKKAFADSGRDANQASYLRSFLHTMKPGDLVVFRTGGTDAIAGEVWIGRIGAYYRATTDYQHRRHVRWFANLARDKDDKDMERATFLRGTISSIKDKPQEDGVNLYTTVANRFELHGHRRLGRIAELVRADYPLHGIGPISGAPEATVAATNLHNQTQNALLDWLQQQFGKDAVQTFDPALGWKAEVDLLLEEDERITIIEVKSLRDGNDLDQLRYGLAQTLDYMDRYGSEKRDVHGVLWLSSEPKDAARWQQLCNRHGIRLGWPGNEQRAFGR